jgi:HK97 family phage portal protein
MWINRLLGGQSYSGVTVTADNALQASAVYACVKVLAETIASLPLVIYRKRPDGGKDIATDHYLYPILHDSPNSFQTAIEFRECQVGHVCLRGNTYGQIVRFGGKVEGILPLNPSRMDIKVVNGKILYYYTPESGASVIFEEDGVWHIRNFPVSNSLSGSAPEGLVGLSPISAARQSVGLQLAGEKYQAKVFANASRPSGALKFPVGKTLKEDALKRLKQSIADATTGDNAHGLLVLEDGLEWQQMGISNQDAQFLELRNFQIADIARIYRVPLVLIGGAGQFDKTATYASAEQFFISFATYTIRPWCVRIEQSANKYLLTEEDRRAGYFVEHNMSGLLRGDTQARYAAYSIARQGAWMSANEIRALENMNPIPGGNEYTNPNINPNPAKPDEPVPPKPKEGQDDASADN